MDDPGFGRKKIVIAGIANTLIGVALEFRATSDGVFLAGKLVNGFSIGILNTVCVAYVSEISPLPLRGVATAACNFSLTIASLLVPVLGVVYGSQNNRWAYVSREIKQTICRTFLTDTL